MTEPPFLDEYLNDAIAAGTAPNGLFAVTIRWPDFQWLIGAVRSIPCAEPSQSDAEWLRVWFANPKYVYVRCRDRRRQAAAYCGRGCGPAVVDALANRLRAEDRSWRGFFERHSIAPLEIRWEDLRADPSDAARRVASFLDLRSLPRRQEHKPEAPSSRPQRNDAAALRKRCEKFPWELGYIVDEQLRDIGFAVVRGRITRPDHLKVLGALACDHQVIGMTCQGIFPMIGALPGNLPDHRGLFDGLGEPYLESVAGWAHCFRTPDEYLPAEVPRILFSNSDNIDPDWIWGAAHGKGPVEKRWDFIYSCMPDSANFVRKNWELAKICAIRFAEELGLRGLLVGVKGVADAPDHPLIEVTPKLPWREFIECLARSRSAFFPNTWDPCPRVMAEAMCLDVPLLVNRNILGGWKYVCDATGSFFNGAEEAPHSIAGLMSMTLQPREWFSANYGPTHAGRRLADFLRTISGGANGAEEIERASFFSPRDYRAMPNSTRPKNG